MKAYGYIAMSLTLLMPPAAPAQIAAGSRDTDGQLLMTDAGGTFTGAVNMSRLDMSAGIITNLSGLSLGGRLHTNWPASTLSFPIQSAKISGNFVSTHAARIDGGNSGWALLFNATNTERAVWQTRLPSDYGSSPIAKIGFAMASATTGTVNLGIDIMAVTPGDPVDVDTNHFDSINKLAGGKPIPADFPGMLEEISLPLTNTESMAAGDLVYFRMSRDQSDAADTATNDVEVRYFQIEYAP